MGKREMGRREAAEWKRKQAQREAEEEYDEDDEEYDEYEDEYPEGSRIPGIIITLILLAVMAVFDFIVYRSGLLPVKFLIPVYVVLLLLVILCAVLVRRTGRVGRFATGAILSVVLAALMLFGGYILNKTVSALEQITDTRTEVTEMSVYVLSDDPAQTITDAKDYLFGYVNDVNASVTTDTLNEISSELGTAVATASYDNAQAVVDALLNGDVGAMILNAAYLDALEEVDGYTDIADRVRQISGYSIETAISGADDDTAASDDNSTMADAGDGVYVIYVSGIDSRTGLIAKSRSDVNILMIANTNTHQALLINTPRDYYVPLSISNGYKDKLTHAGIYGVNVSMDTIGMLYDVDVDYYFRVNFTGFETIIDALGGITVYSDYAFTSVEGYTFTAGENQLDGENALAFARERKAFTSGDNQRGKNQMAVIKAVIEKATTPAILTGYTTILDSLQGSFDSSIPYDLISEIVRDQLDSGASWDVQTYAVTGTGDSQIPWSMSAYAYVMQPDQDSVDTAKSLITQMLAGETVTVPQE